MFDFNTEGQWTIVETDFDPTALGKAEANFCLGNGYLGLRSATEEKYLGETRDLLVAGTFNRISEEESVELPNAADVTNIELHLNGERFDQTQGTLQAYRRALNIRTGMLTRDVTWCSPSGDSFVLKFERIVSLKRLHTIAARVTVCPAQDTTVEIQSGIDGRMTCGGSQHFSWGTNRFYDKKYLQYVPHTLQSNITFVLDATHRFFLDGQEIQPDIDIDIQRRTMFSRFTVNVKAGETLVFEKYSNVYTTRDKETEDLSVAELQTHALDALKQDEADGFDALAQESADCWEEKVWNRVPITIEGAPFDQLVIRFAQYHMQLMTPAHDHRMNIGAKGFSGEGYKGHTFWDTEIFLLPYFIFTMPEVARGLEEHRYLSLPGAHEKAKGNGYQGAQFPWESAWLTDGEVTSKFKGTDIVTGKLIRVLTGVIEIHITADVAFGVWQYYECTGDQDYMDRYGYELILDCAKFWGSRLEPGEDGKLHINDVIGPDEYKEHVNDNAYTNYMAWWNIGKAIEYTEQLREEKPELYRKLDEKLDLAACYPAWVEKRGKIFLNQPTEEGILPQDSTYLSLPEIDLTKYKKQPYVNGIFKDYNMDQISKIQVSKQADVMVLFYLLEDLFPHEVKVASWNYYEPHCLHDSSLSLSTHSVLACDIGDTKLGYEMFRKASLIDLDNGNPHSSDEGIHAASYGGLWQCVVYGFGGLRMLGGNLRISPALPEAWTKLSYRILWRGQALDVTVTKDDVSLVNETKEAPISLEIWGQTYTFTDRLSVAKQE